jgi:hypothetical protein
MKGSIRFVAGLLLAVGAVGGIEFSVTDAEFLQSTALAVVGLAIMYSGVSALKENV